MIGTFHFELLDPADSVSIRQYERAFFTAFQRARSNRLVRSLWNWDDENRLLATRIPYEDQLIYVLRDRAGVIESGLAFNTAMRGFQSAAFGFAVPHRSARALEVLTFFSVANRDFRVKKEFWRRCAEAARTRGWRTAYATTAQRPLRPYLRIGWDLLAEAEIGSERRYFLRYDLNGMPAPRLTPATVRPASQNM